MPPMRETVAAWEAAAQAPTARQAIHPAGGNAQAYAESGSLTAAHLAKRIGPDRPDLRIVDFGAGDGRVTIPLAAIYPGHVGAVDASPTMLERLRELDPSIPTFESDGTDLDELDLAPDVIVALAVLIHHRHDDATAILKGLARALRPDGRLYLDLALYEESREPTGWTDIATWTALELNAAALEAGLFLLGAPVSPGAFSWDAPLGPHHGELLELAKP